MPITSAPIGRNRCRFLIVVTNPSLWQWSHCTPNQKIACSITKLSTPFWKKYIHLTVNCRRNPKCGSWVIDQNIISTALIYNLKIVRPTKTSMPVLSSLFFRKKVLTILRKCTKHANFELGVQHPLKVKATSPSTLSLFVLAKFTNCAITTNHGPLRNMWYDQANMSQNWQILFLRYSQTTPIVAFVCYILFVQSFNCLYLWNQLPNLCGVFTKLKPKQYPKRKCQKKKKIIFFDFRLILLDRITYESSALHP